jgi:uncharacterized protein YbjT (DUF2867 family)
MASEKTIAVIGATGAQGGGLAHAILNDHDSEFRVRAITRNPASDEARALADQGAEVVQADLDDVDSVTAAFDGCWGAFCVTNFWEHFSPEKELAHAKNLATAAKEAGVRHAIWSTLEDTRRWVPLDDDRMPTLMERYKVPHFDAKGEADRLFTEAGVPTTFLIASFYWDNFIHFGSGPERGEDGTLVLAMPMGDAKLAGIAAEDIGKCAYGIVKAGDELIGETIGIAGGHPTGAEMAAGLTEAMGEPVRYLPLSFDQYRSLGFPGAEDLGNMFQFYHDFEDDGLALRSIERSRALNPDLMSFERWLEKYGEQIPRP